MTIIRWLWMAHKPARPVYGELWNPQKEAVMVCLSGFVKISELELSPTNQSMQQTLYVRIATFILMPITMNTMLT